jgi:hypothetical protein
MDLGPVCAPQPCARETVTTTHPLAETSLRLRIGVPHELRARFVSPAATAFAVFALGGFYAALAPTLLRRDLHEANVAISGALVHTDGAGARRR